jgi:hypothetical protein
MEYGVLDVQAAAKKEIVRTPVKDVRWNGLGRSKRDLLVEVLKLRVT